MTAIIRKAGRLRVRKANCFVVLMRNMNEGELHGHWQPISTEGFVVVCASQLEAAELTWLMGVRFFPRPNPHMGDMRYLTWLWRHHLKLEPYQATGHGEVMYGLFARGWRPDAEDYADFAASPTTEMARAALRFRLRGR
jgi:hypothetical protein